MRIRLLYRKQINSAVDANEDHIKQISSRFRPSKGLWLHKVSVWSWFAVQHRSQRTILLSFTTRVFIGYTLNIKSRYELGYWWRSMLLLLLLVVVEVKRENKKKSEWIVLIVYWSQPPGGDQYARPHFWESLYIVVCSDIINLTRFNSSSI